MMRKETALSNDKVSNEFHIDVYVAQICLKL